MEVYLRMEVNVIAAILLIFLIRNTRRDMLAMLDDILFQMLLYASLLSVIIEIWTWYLDGKGGQGVGIVLTIIHAVYFALSVLIPYLWLLYVDYRLIKDSGRFKHRKIMYLVPYLAFLVIVVATPFTGWLFYIDGQNVYHRGSLYLVQIFLSFVYVLVPSFLALKYATKQRLASERKECYSIASFILFPVAGALIQVLFYGLPVVSITIAFAELSIFLSVQNKQISLDALTKANNRGQFNRYLEARVNAPRRDKKLYMLLLDIDKFKAINDTYGHKEGDCALINMVEILRRVCGMYQGFLARYGGDEFAVVMECSSEEKVERFMKSVAREIKLFNQKTDAPYELEYSVGYAELKKDSIETMEDLIEAADQSMYVEKTKNRISK